MQVNKQHINYSWLTAPIACNRHVDIFTLIKNDSVVNVQTNPCVLVLSRKNFIDIINVGWSSCITKMNIELQNRCIAKDSNHSTNRRIYNDTIEWI